jgi:predicted TIM-barrel fold metal-dependent hydrolase
MRDGFVIVDTHTHIGTARHSGRKYSCEQLLRDMDRAGVDRSVVIPFPAVEDYRTAHDEIGRAVLAHPDRVTGAASLYPFIRESEFRTEVARCREQFGFRALKLQPQFHPLNPLSESGNFLFEAALENGMSVICHTGAGIPFALPSLFMAPARRFPGLKIVLAHSGGGGIFVGEAIVAAMFCPNIYLELSSLMPHHVLEVTKHVPCERLMIGSDLPESLDTEIGKILGANLPDDSKRAILSETALMVFSRS